MDGYQSAGSLPLPGVGEERRRASARVGVPMATGGQVPAVEIVAEQRPARVPGRGRRPPTGGGIWWLVVGLLLVVTILAIVALVVLLMRRAAPQPIPDGQPLRPTASGWVRGGTYRVPAVDIPPDVTLTAAGDLELIVSGDTHIAGRLAGDCVAITVRGTGDVVVTGSIDNVCPADAAQVKDLVVQTSGGALALGTAEAPARLHTSGTLDIADDPALEAWQFDVLPAERSAEPLAPVCRIEANPITGLVLPPPATPDVAADGTVAAVPRPAARVVFSGAGADPDGGPVTLRWDFGDGGGATELAPEHAYATSGTFDVTLDVSDDDGQSCQATAWVVVEDGQAVVATPGVWAAPRELVVARGAEAFFAAQAPAPGGAEVTYRWDFGDGGTSDEALPGHIYPAAGRYDVRLTVSVPGAAAITATAASSVYVYEPGGLAQARLAAPPAQRPVTENLVDLAATAMRLRYGGDVVFLPGSRWVTTAPLPRPGDVHGRAAGGIELFAAGSVTFLPGQGDSMGSVLAGAGNAGVGAPERGGDGGRGGAIAIVAEGDVALGSGAMIAAGDGGAGGTPPAGPLVAGGTGGDGGRLVIKSGGQLSIDSGVSLAGGTGGTGGDAAATSGGAPTRAYARAGSGGSAGGVSLSGALGLQFASKPGTTAPDVTIWVGRGGAGGTATATGTAGPSTCPRGGDGAGAVALGGQGGNGPGGWSPAGAGCQSPVTVLGGDGGTGGGATATGGDGGPAGTGGAPCTSAASGGEGGPATATGGRGGPAGALRLAGCSDLFQPGGPAGNPVFSGGHGGLAIAAGGAGGEAGAAGPACGESATAEAGAGGRAEARGGNGAPGHSIAGRGGDAGAYPGQGGTATARGGDCQPRCGRPGGKAFARGGDGGPGSALGGLAGAPGAPDGAAAVALDLGQGYGLGQGGNAVAIGGAGGDCEARECPSGKGGTGGPAGATGGTGGEQEDAEGKRVARDGDATATGGAGGRGAACCNPPAPGGAGSVGGDAEAHTRPTGAVTARGGDGGAGGDGLGPGTGGAGGVPGGRVGAAGRVCVVTPTPTPAPTDPPTATPTASPSSSPAPPTATAVPTATSGQTPTVTSTDTPAATAASTKAPTVTTTAPPTDMPPPAARATATVAADAARAAEPPGVVYLAYDAGGRPPMNDLRVRRLLTQLIDRAALVGQAGASGARLADGLIPPDAYPDPAARAAQGYPGLPYDPAAAADLQEELRSTPGARGWPDEMTLAAPRPEQAVAEAIAAAWEANGIHVQLQYFELLPGETVDTPRYRDWLRKEPPQVYLRAWRTGHTYDVFLTELLEDTPLRWSPEEARAHLLAVEAAGRSDDDRDSADAVLQVEQLLIKDAVLYVPLFYYN